MRQSIAALTPGLSAITLILLVGCTAPQLSQRVLDAPKATGPINMFAKAGGAGALSIRIIDQRPRRVQNFADADSFNAVYFRLSNSVKLKASLATAVNSLGGGTSTYTTVFPAIPADPGGNYALSVGLYRNIGTPANAADTGYTVLANKVGEGATNNITINPGENKSVTVKINAVGDFIIESPTIHINHATPVLMSGDSAIVNTLVNNANNPGVNQVNVYLTDLADAVIPGASISVGNIASPSTVVPSITLPYVASSQNYKLVVDAFNTSSGSYLLSRRVRNVSIEATASIGTVTMN